jgi:hypothetical protein
MYISGYSQSTVFTPAAGSQQALLSKTQSHLVSLMQHALSLYQLQQCLGQHLGAGSAGGWSF